MQWKLVSAFDAVVQPRDRGIRLHRIRPTNRNVSESMHAVPEHFGRFRQVQWGQGRGLGSRLYGVVLHGLESVAGSLLLHVEFACLQKRRRLVRS